ncbi:MAG: PAS domain-containing sensor histidine kinase [Gammaproteobacteria bacterium]|nr:PAS domain-containing sensor histidine kinase [Gammaproteobacteria bacterium]
MQKTKKQNAAILNEQVQLLYAALPFSTIVSLVNASILVYIERSVVPHHILGIWLACLLVTTAYRGMAYLLYKRSKLWSTYDVRWGYINIFGVLMSSVVWGGASIFLFPAQSIEHQAFLGFVIAGMSAGAISTLSYFKHAILIFLTCTLPPLAIQFIIEGNEFGIAMGSMVTIYYFVLYSVAVKNYNNSFQNIKLRFNAEEQQKALKQSEEKYHAIFNSAPLGILHYTPAGEITSQNSMALGLIEVDNESLRQINLLTHIQDEDFLNAIKASLQGEIGQYKGSTEAIFSYSNKPIRMSCRGIHDVSGDISGGVAILEDITEENRVDRLKNEFVSTVSHELRTPLTAIYGSSQLLQNAKESISKDQVDTLLSNISRNSERLLHLVNDILDVEKISTGKMDFHFEKMYISDLLSQSVSDNEAYADKHKVKFVLLEFPESVKLMVDKNRFQQVMANFLSNAAKFSPSGSDVEVGARIIENDSNVIRIFVKDCGPGIPVDFQGKIFEKFTQSDASDTRKVGGTGLGLTISKEIVERMNGQLDFETEPGKGSTFYFDLPIID